MPENITIHTDGACSGNPGPGGFGAVIQVDGQDWLTVTGGDPATTNNRMEISAVIESLRALNSVSEFAETPRVTVRSDSKYVIDAFNQGWIQGWQRNGWRNAKKQDVANQELWQNLLQEIQGRNISWEWVRGHSGDPMNELCDQLAVAERDFAAQTQGYWASAGNPRSLVEGRTPGPAKNPRADYAGPMTPQPPAMDAGVKALMLLDWLLLAILTNDDMEGLKKEARLVRAHLEETRCGANI